METKVKALSANDILTNARVRIEAVEQYSAANLANATEVDGE